MNKTPYLRLFDGCQEGCWTESAPISVVRTRMAVPLRLEVAHDTVTPAGFACVESYVSGHLASRTLVPECSVDTFVSVLGSRNTLVLAREAVRPCLSSEVYGHPRPFGTAPTPEEVPGPIASWPHCPSSRRLSLLWRLGPGSPEPSRQPSCWTGTEHR